MSQSKVIKAIIDQQDAGQRIDNYLMRVLKGVPKTRIYKALRKGEVRINGGRVKAEYRLAAGDEIRIPPLRQSAPKQRLKPDQALSKQLEDAVLFENDAMIIIDKPAGLPVHGGTQANSGVIEWLRLLRPKAKRLELVHRLDRDTSGCLLIAKNRTNLAAMQQQFAERSVEKTYHAVVQGEFRGKQLVDAPLLRVQNSEGARKVVVSPSEGKSSYTELRSKRTGNRLSLLEARLLTGRMHQIRVHCAHIGLPIVGDPRYGDWALNRWVASKGVKRMLLHASSLVIDWQQQKLRFEAPLPDEFNTVFQYDDQSLSD